MSRGLHQAKAHLWAILDCRVLHWQHVHVISRPPRSARSRVHELVQRLACVGGGEVRGYHSGTHVLASLDIIQRIPITCDRLIIISTLPRAQGAERFDCLLTQNRAMGLGEMVRKCCVAVAAAAAPMQDSVVPMPAKPVPRMASGDC